MNRVLKQHLLRWILSLILIIKGITVIGQTYPVQTNVVAVGPYFNYLSYYADENAHLQAIVTLTDFNSGPVQARLRIQIQGPGYTISTKPNVVIGQAFTLEPGIPQIINGIDLAPYFFDNNVVKSPSGLNLNRLPEGLTTVCIDVIREGVSQEVISTNNCTSFFLQHFQPSQLIFPTCGSNVQPDDMFYTFQWTSPIGYVPSIGSELNYTFSLYEWNDPNNYNIFQTGQGLVYQGEVSQPLLQLSSFDLTLQAGKTYVWRVQAHILSNGVPVQMIENNGYSGFCTFTYGTSQTLEESLADGLHIDISAMGEGERKGRANWTVIDNTPGEGLSTFSSFIVYYRKKPTGNEGFELTWFQDTVSTFNHFINQLEPATTYEVKVAGRIGEDYVSAPSEVKDFNTYSPRAYACGDTDLPYRSTSFQPLIHAQAGMYFQIGQFSMQITEIQSNGSTGYFAGRGLVPIAFLGGARAMVQFNNIFVDDKYTVREGIVEVLTKGVDQWLHEQYQQFIDPHYVQGTIDSAYVENGSAWVVVNGNAVEFPFVPSDYPVIVNDDSGNQYIIHPDGTITVNSYFEIHEEWEVDASMVVTFAQSTHEKFGFDGKEHTQWHANYEIIELSDDSKYFVANKSLGVNETDVVRINYPSNTSGSYTYKINNGPSQPLVGDSLVIPKQGSKGDFNLEVFKGSQKVGKLKLIVFEEKEIDLVVVPLVASAPSKANLESILESTLGESNLKFNVTIAPQWNNEVYTSSKSIQLPEDVGLLNKYSQEMKGLRDAYISSRDTLAKNAFYLFVVPSFSDNSVDGYMVRGKSLGFVAADADLLTYAHELGHGVGTLAHSWQDNGPTLGTTNNLMDYSTDSRNLIKSQWKAIRSWSVLPSLWDEEEDGESVYLYMKDLEPFKNVGGSYTFLNCNRSAITLPANTEYIIFSTLDRFFKINSEVEVDKFAPIGSLIGFKVGGNNFKWISNGYYRKGVGQEVDIINDSLKYIDTLTDQVKPIDAITSFFFAADDDLMSVFFKVTITSEGSKDSWVVFDDGSIDQKTVNVNQYVNHFSKSSYFVSDLSTDAFGTRVLPIKVIKEGASNIELEITPLNVFQILTEENLTVKSLLNYLIFANSKKIDFESFASCIRDNMTLKINEESFREIIEKRKLLAFGIPPILIDDIPRFDNFIEEKELLEQYFEDAIYEVFKYYRVGVDSMLINSLSLAVDKKDQGNVNGIIKGFPECILNSIPTTLRINAFLLLIEDDSYWNDAYKLIKTVPPSETTTFFNNLISSNWLDLAIPNLDNWNGDREDLSVLLKISNGISNLITQNLNHPAVTSSKYSLTMGNPLVPEPIIFEYTPLNHPVFFTKRAEYKEYSPELGVHLSVNFQDPSKLGSISWVNGKIHVYQSYTLGEGGFSFNTPGSSPPTTQMNIHYELKPHELVKVVFLDHYAQELGFDSGDEVIVPAFYLLLYQQGIENEQFHDNFAVITDIAAVTISVLLTPVTLGGSLYVTGVTLLAIHNQNVQAEKANASTSELHMYQSWDNFYTAVNIVEGAVGITQFALNLPRIIVASKGILTKLSTIPDNIGTLWSAIKGFFKGSSGVGRFIANSGQELQNHLSTIVNKPIGKSYNGDVYRSLSKSSETNYGALPDQMTDHHIYSSWGRYDLPGEENAMYLSKTVTGNQTELVPHYGNWNDFSTYKYTNVQADNLLDLTDDIVRQQLGTEFEQLTMVFSDKVVMYEFTNELAVWARQNGYNGLIVPGARGAKNYENVIIFEQSYINQILQGKNAIPIPK